MVSQPIKEYTLGLIKRLPASITNSKKADAPRLRLRTQTLGRSEQHSSRRRYEIPPLHLSLIKREDEGGEYHVSFVVVPSGCKYCIANAARVSEGCGSGELSLQTSHGVASIF